MITDEDIIKKLIIRKAKIAENPVNGRRKNMWRNLNYLKAKRPMIWINEIPWHEMEVNEELTLKTRDPMLRQVEYSLRKDLYKWQYMPGDMVLEKKILSPLALDMTDFSYEKEIESKKMDENSTISSRNYKSRINTEEDFEKMEFPKINYNHEKSLRYQERIEQIAANKLKVEKNGWYRIDFCPVDELSKWWGAEQFLMDLLEKPGLVHKGMEKIMQEYERFYSSIKEKGLLKNNNGNNRVGSGGYGYNEELCESSSNDAKSIDKVDLWGESASQIFSNVSPEMHKEFAWTYEKQWLKDYGLTYYGCCEPLDDRIETLRELNNLRKISISPWSNLENAAENIGEDYVLSFKPSPAIFAWEKWDIEQIRREFRKKLDKMKGLNIEIIMKDISTVNYEPSRLWEWAAMAHEERKKTFNQSPK